MDNGTPTGNEPSVPVPLNDSSADSNSADATLEPDADSFDKLPDVPSHLLIMEGCSQRGSHRNRSLGVSDRPASAIPSISLLGSVDSQVSLTSIDGEDSSRYRARFSIEALRYHLESCARNESRELDLDSYLEAYAEICKLLEGLGSVIRKYIVRDIHNKIALMRKHQEGPNGDFYATIEEMVAFEMELSRQNQEDNFVASFLRNLIPLSNDQPVGTVGKEAYSQTLAPFHPLFYRHIAQLAFSFLGNKRQFVANFHDGSMSQAQLQEVIGNVVNAATLVYTRCEAIYRKNNLLDIA